MLNYNGVRVNFSEKELAKIAEIKARRARQPQSSDIVGDIDRVQRHIERDLSIILLRKTTSMTYPEIAELYGMTDEGVRKVVDRAREGNYDHLGLWFCGNMQERR